MARERQSARMAEKATETAEPSKKSTQFESEVCSRCGGTGHYSYCQRFGTTCFKCGGRKNVLTKRGHAAYLHYVSLKSRPARDINPGDTIRDIVVTESGSVGTTWLKVESVETAEDGTVRIQTNGVLLFGISPDTLYEIGMTGEQKRPILQAALAYQDKLTKQGTPRKRA